VLADDGALFRDGLARLLGEAGIDVVGLAEDAVSLKAVVEAERPDVAIIDVRMPPTFTTEGLHAAIDIRRAHPEVATLVLSQVVETHAVTELLGERPERVAYLLKERVTDVGELLAALDRIVAGGSVIDPEVVGRLLARRHVDDPLEALSDREREVLGLMAEGRSNHAIAEQLWLTDKTIESHVRNIFAKLRLPADAQDHRRVLAVLTFLRDRVQQR
jgi:DNA-binding NarL/FixJ family response regulator